jgi:isopenicillin-N N-acyltransferase like protein
MSLYELRQVHVSGSPRHMGRQQGEALRAEIRTFVEQRVAAMQTYFAERGRSDAASVLECGARCLEVARGWDPEGTDETFGIAEGANIDPARLYSATNMTDIRDVVLMPDTATRAELAIEGASSGTDTKDEGCSAIMIPPGLAADGRLIAAQTWDLNPEDLDFVVAIERRPDEGPRTWSVTCAGALSLVGMNELGVAVGTTNIKIRRNRVGVGYLSVLHRAIRCPTRAHAVEAVRTAPRAAAHTYWLADSHGASELECSATEAVERTLGEHPLVRTNHCIAPNLRTEEGEAATISTEKRLQKLTLVASRGSHDTSTLRALFADRSDGIHSINRYAEDAQGTSTNACVIFVPSERKIAACRGPADRGKWVELGF